MKKGDNFYLKLGKNFETKVILISNTLGSFVLGLYFSSLKTIVGYLLGIFCIVNIFCFFCLIGDKNE